jgi:two-component system, sensor histidine kinase RegB
MTMPKAAVEPAPLINLRWLIRLRWLAVAGQAITILTGQQVITHPLPVTALLGVCALLAVLNLGVMAWLWRGGEPTDRAAVVNLLFDIGALTALLALAGGAFNPFSLLYLVHITIAAVILPARWTLLIAFASVAAYSSLQIIPVGRLVLSGPDEALMQVRGTWVAFVVAAAFISTFSFRMSQALRRREAELAHVRQDVEVTERLAALGTLAAATAHELNTPLATIAILAGELADQVEGERRSEAEEIRKQVRRCKEIITSMLAPRGDAAIEEPKEFEVAPVLAGCVARWQQGRPGPRPIVVVDPAVARARARLPLHAFEQAMANLLDNAAEATEGRAESDIRIVLSRNGDDLRLTVADNGVGVPEALQNRIGEPFFTTKGPGRGSGLGLYLARHVVERQGGEMEVLSAEGRGTQVVLTVPEASA